VLVSVRLAAQCRWVPVNSDVMRQAVEMQVASQTWVAAGKSRPSSASLAAHVLGSRVRFVSRTIGGSHAVLHQMPPEPERLDQVLRTAVRAQACLFERAARRSGGGAVLEGDASLTRPRNLAAPGHNRSFDTDAQVLQCASRTRLPVAGQLRR
jgi:hypothetical protein